MKLTSDIAKSMTELTARIQPVFALQGIRKGQHLEKSYRYQFPSSPTRHIAIMREDTRNGITVYINNISVLGNEFSSSKIDGIDITEMYPAGYEGKNGNKGIAGSVARLSSLNPKDNDVVRLTISSESSFSKLLEWYFGIDSKNSNFSNDQINIQEESSLDEIYENMSLSESDQSDESLGYQIDPKKRKCVELYAEDCAIQYYVNRGFSVERKGKPYDLLCINDNLTIHVEVKGTTGLLNKVILTRNEIIDAKNINWQSDLFIVHGILLTESNGVWQASGGKQHLLAKWQLKDIDLSPLTFEYRVPKE